MKSYLLPNSWDVERQHRTSGAFPHRSNDCGNTGKVCHSLCCGRNKNPQYITMIRTKLTSHAKEDAPWPEISAYSWAQLGFRVSCLSRVPYLMPLPGGRLCRRWSYTLCPCLEQMCSPLASQPLLCHPLLLVQCQWWSFCCTEDIPKLGCSHRGSATLENTCSMASAPHPGDPAHGGAGNSWATLALLACPCGV